MPEYPVTIESVSSDDPTPSSQQQAGVIGQCVLQATPLGLIDPMVKVEQSLLSRLGSLLIPRGFVSI